MSKITDFFWILNLIASSVEPETPCFSKASSSINLVGKCSSAITQRAITVRSAPTSFGVPRGASIDKDFSVFKLCFFTDSMSLARSTRSAANKRPSTSSGPPKLTCYYKKVNKRKRKLQFGKISLYI